MTVGATSCRVMLLPLNVALAAVTVTNVLVDTFAFISAGPGALLGADFADCPAFTGM